ncbi:MAG: LrgB family protein [Alcanivorax sp.]|uniref:LrgB family protein n=1 Tax=Alloalcanivorax marinus TaxID=1177169 RepID=A0A9Q3YNK7_9GAMM|nr:LrgB family protein [Alloalcanivorax marinus]MBM7333023.1 LrgB family protein [Alloalcanivorax marinus]MCC4309887.1 LrgB family protein [Alloalcanivorax marinus]MCU5786434.1 effector of murein hydrolase [Alloalcanivorax marinus]
MTELVHTPLFGLILTLASYRMAIWIYGKAHSLPVLHPFLVASIPVIVVLPLVGLSYEEYRQQTEILSFLLGPATVALAWPLYRQLRTVRQVWRPVLITTLVGAALAAGISIGLAWWLGAPEPVVGSLAPKSITTPIAVEVVKSTDGFVSLAAGAVAITGIVGALLAGPVFRLLRVRDDRVRGFALGLVAHAIGTARAFEFGEKAGAFAGLALGLTGLVTALALPWLWPWIAGWLF